MTDEFANLPALFDAAQEAENSEALALSQRYIQQSIREQVARRSDGIRRFIVWAERLAEDAKRTAKLWSGRAEMARAYVQGEMEAAGVRRIDTPTGSLSIRGNGGVEPLVIDDEALIPERFKDVTLTVRADHFVILNGLLAGYIEGTEDNPITAWNVKESVSNSRIREALAQPCERCEGRGTDPLGSSDHPVSCSACQATGKRVVPGAHIGERGKSLVVK